MNATQGVILIMIGALALYLMWSAQSPFSQARQQSGPPVSNANPLPGAAPGWGGFLGAPGWTPKGPASGWGRAN